MTWKSFFRRGCVTLIENVGVIIRQLFAGFHIADSLDPYAKVVYDGIAIRVTRVIDESRVISIYRGIDDDVVIDREEVGVVTLSIIIRVTGICLSRREPLAGVLDEPRPRRNSVCGKCAHSLYGRRTDSEWTCHQPGILAALRGLKYVCRPFKGDPMRITALLGCALLVVGCSKKEAPPADTAAAVADSAAPMQTVSLASVAAIWNVVVKPEGKDTVVTSYILNTTDTTEWHFQFPKGKPIAMKITGIRGDTIVTETGIFDSALRPGQKVQTSSLVWLQDGKLMGKVVAHYQNANRPDSVVNLVTEGTRQ